MEKQTEVHTDTDTTDNNLSIVRDDSGRVDESGCGERTIGAKPAEKQEWSFTLYDLDGQGRVTKEEVAQLLKSLYDAVGSSIDLPQTGTKTVKLHLTVSPDKPKEEDEINERSEKAEEVDINCKECNSDKDKGQDQKKDINSKLNNGVAAGKLAHKHNSWDVGPLKVELPNNLSKANKEGHMHGSMKRISPLEQKQLAELVKMNMQRNKEKKLKHNQSQRTGKHRHSTAVPLSHILENPDRRSYYLDLAGIENPTTITLPISPNAVTSSRLQPVKLRTKSKGTSHRRSRDRTASQGHLLADHIFGPVDVDISTQEPVKRSHQHRQSSPKAAVESPAAPVFPNSKAKGGASPHHRHTPKKTTSPQKFTSSKSSPKYVPAQTLEIRAEHAEQVSERVTSTPKGVQATMEVADPAKHRKHKKKDKNHVRAMLQVAKWIEKEHQQGLEHVTVEKHEHHHFHEHHHHHHYHHYYQAS